MGNIKSKAVKSLSWTSGGQIINQSISFIVSVILARLLSPDEFGVMAIVVVFMGIAQLFQDLGFGGALLQSQKVLKEDYSTVFFFNLLASGIATVILIVSAPFIANFYEKEIIKDLLTVLAFGNIISAIGSVHATRLKKKLEFKSIVKIDVVSNLLSSMVAIYIINLGYGIWGLVFRSLVGGATTTLLYWISSRWVPSFVFSIPSLKKFWSFSIYLFWSDFFSKVFNEVENLIIGKIYLTSQLGLYTRAKTLQKLPGQIYSTAFTKVLFPVFSRIQDDNVQLKRYYQILIHFISFSLIPIYLWMVSQSYNIILILLGEQWIETAPMLALFSLVGFLNPISVANINLFISKGLSKFSFKFELVKRIIILMVILTTVPFGIYNLIYGLIIVTVVGFLANIFYAGRLINFRPIDQILIILPYLFIAIVSAGISKLILLLFSDSNLLSLTTSFILNFLIYILLNKIFKLRALPIIFTHTPAGKLMHKYAWLNRFIWKNEND